MELKRYLRDPFAPLLILCRNRLSASFLDTNFPSDGPIMVLKANTVMCWQTGREPGSEWLMAVLHQTQGTRCYGVDSAMSLCHYTRKGFFKCLLPSEHLLLILAPRETYWINGQVSEESVDSSAADNHTHTLSL